MQTATPRITPRPPLFSTRWPSSPVPLTAKGLTAEARASIHDFALAVRFLCHPDSGLIIQARY
jgi:hypothetical protein